MKRHVLISWVILAGVGALALAGCMSVRPPHGVASIEREMVVTGYCRCGQCTGWRRTWYGVPVYASGPQKGARKDVGVTASGTTAAFGTVAADTQLYPFGTVVYVPGYGYGRVEDCGGDVKGNHLDLYFRSHSQAEAWGRQVKKVSIWLPTPGKR